MGLLEWVPPPTGENPVWWPISAPQLTALHSKAQILLYGGASGGGKTDFLVADAMQEYENPNLRAILIRKSFKEMNQIMDRCRAIYQPFGAFWRATEDSWLFPSGARIRLGYMANDNSITRYQGNPFSYLGIDESTLLPENQFRDILPWLTSTDPSLFPRARLCSNPGNVGAAWHLKVFLRDKCPIHFPKESVESGSVYKGSRWMQDDELVRKTVSFIIATANDNPLYGEDKMESLESQNVERRQQLKEGCWCKLEGMYFKFLSDLYKVNYPSIMEPRWATHFMSVDYGFSNSAAASGLYFREEPTGRWPAGRILKVGEYIERQLGSYEYAEEMCRRFVVDRQIQGTRPQISACYYDPAMDAHTGTGRSNAEIMSDVFERHDIPMLKAAKDRIGNAQMAYKMLKSGEFGICADVCPKTWSSFRTRMHDPKLPGAVLKVKSEDLDDVYDECLVAGTRVMTSTGEVPIEDVQIGTLVYTRKGLKRVSWSGVTGENRMVNRVLFSDGRSVVATGNHPFFVEGRGFIRVDELEYGDNILSWAEWKKSSSTESRLGDIQTPKVSRLETTSLPASPTSARASICSTGKCGSSTMARFRPASTCTTSMALHGTRLTTLSVSRPRSIGRGIQTRRGRTRTATVLISRRSGLKQLSGTVRSKGRSGTVSTSSDSTLRVPSAISLLARYAGARLQADKRAMPSSAAGHVQQREDARADLTMLSVPVSFVGQASNPAGLIRYASAPVFVSSVTIGGRERVYNLTVEECPEFFANGVLVHNSVYGLNTYVDETIKPKEAKAAETLQEYREAGLDDHSLHIYAAKLSREMLTPDVEARMGRGRATRRQ